jgi:hypothetical protein
MISEADFVHRSVAHQLGGADSLVLSYDLDAVDLAERASSQMMLAWSHLDQAPLSLNGWLPSPDPDAPDAVVNPNHGNAYKIQLALKSMLEAGLDFDVLIDMQDHRARNLLTETGESAPVLAFNRPTGKRTGHILWPLPFYHDVENPEFLGQLDPARVPWDDKTDTVVWRGGPGNRGRLGKHGRGGLIRLLPLLRRFKTGKLSADETERALLTMPRYRFVHNHITDPRFDIGFTNSDGFILAEEPFIDRLERPRIARTDFQRHKYIAVLPGSDVGSSFYWTMNSGSVGLVVDCDFETFATHHFKPWEHFVPIRPDQRDIDAQLAWCVDNQDACRLMTERAAEMCKLLADKDLRHRVNQGVLAGMRAAMRY